MTVNQPPLNAIHHSVEIPRTDDRRLRSALPNAACPLRQTGSHHQTADPHSTDDHYRLHGPSLRLVDHYPRGARVLQMSHPRGDCDWSPEPWVDPSRSGLENTKATRRWPL